MVSKINAGEASILNNSLRLDSVESTLVSHASILEDHEDRITALENPVDNDDADDKLWTSLWSQVVVAKSKSTPTYIMTQKGPIDLRGVSTVAVAGGKVNFAMEKSYAYDVMGWNTVWVRG